MGEAKVTVQKRTTRGTGVDLQSSKYISQSKMSIAGKNSQHIYIESCLHYNFKSQILVSLSNFRLYFCKKELSQFGPLVSSER